MWRQRIGFSTLLFGRHHQPGCSSPSTAVNMGETKEMQDLKEKLLEKKILSDTVAIIMDWGSLSFPVG